MLKGSNPNPYFNQSNLCSNSILHNINRANNIIGLNGKDTLNNGSTNQQFKVTRRVAHEICGQLKKLY